MVPHVEEDALNDLNAKIHSHDPSGSGDIQNELQKSLLWYVSCTFSILIFCLNEYANLTMSFLPLTTG